MSKLNDLITQLCPDGVPYKKLGDLCVSGNKGMLKKNELIPDGKYPVVNGGMNYYGRYNQYNNDKDCFVFSSRGSAGYVSYQRAPFYAAALCYPFMSSNENIIMTRFMYFFLKQNEAKNIDKLVAKGSIPALNKADVLNIEIPLPPLPVQEEVVRILDSFTELEAELEAELDDRKEQYEYYRDYLLDKKNLERMDGKPVEMRKFGEAAHIGKGTYITKKETKPGEIPVILGGTTPAYWHNEANHEGEAIVISRSGANAGFVSYWNEPIFVSDGFIVETDNALVCRYLYHVLKSAQNAINALKRGGGVPHVNGKMLADIELPVPSLATQERVVDILDRFDALTTSLTDGIPAEIAMRREQYEYYRSRLLDFPHLPNGSASVSAGE